MITKLSVAILGIFMALTISFIPPFNSSANSKRYLTEEQVIEQVKITNAIIDSNNRVLYERNELNQVSYKPAIHYYWNSDNN